MNFTVVYRPSATQQIAQLWNDAPDRAAVTAAANALDADLRKDPFARSESRGGNRRIKVEFPLAVYYDVSHADCLVTVHAVWRVA